MPRQRWVVLVAGLVAVTAGCAVQYGTPFLIPALRADGLTLAQAGLLAGCPIAGLLVTLVAWGAAADRYGERRVLTLGLGAGGLVLLAGARLHGSVALGATFLLAGAATAAVHAASGRLVLGWFAAHERGRAMAIRQCAQPLGVAIAALALPSLSHPSLPQPSTTHSGLPLAVAALGGGCLAATGLALALVRDPVRPRSAAGQLPVSPYRSSTLWRIHGASSMLVVPQFVIATFSLVYLVDVQGWSAAPAGRLLAAAQVGGAATRLAAGYWSDRVGSRLRPMRLLAVATGVVLAALAAATLAGATAAAVVALVIATMLAVSTNGLAFTAVAERAGSAWAGRALGVQNTAQNALAAATPPVFGLLIGVLSYGVGFAVAVAFPVLACLLVPVDDEATGVGAAPRPPVSDRREGPPERR
jgi:MFS family permease